MRFVFSNGHTGRACLGSCMSWVRNIDKDKTIFVNHDIVKHNYTIILFEQERRNYRMGNYNVGNLETEFLNCYI